MILIYYQMKIYMRKKGRGCHSVSLLSWYEADNSDRVSCRLVICYHNSNSISIAIVIIWLIETNLSSYAGRSRPHSTQLAASHLKHQNQLDQSLQLLCKCCTTTILCLPHFLFCCITLYFIFKNVYGNWIVTLILQTTTTTW